MRNGTTPPPKSRCRDANHRQSGTCGWARARSTARGSTKYCANHRKRTAPGRPRPPHQVFAAGRSRQAAALQQPDECEAGSSEIASFCTDFADRRRPEGGIRHGNGFVHAGRLPESSSFGPLETEVYLFGPVELFDARMPRTTASTSAARCASCSRVVEATFEQLLGATLRFATVLSDHGGRVEHASPGPVDHPSRISVSAIAAVTVG